MKVIKIIFNIVIVLVVLFSIFFDGLWSKERINVMKEFIKWNLVFVGLW